MLKLAEEYARLLKTRVIASRSDGEALVFVLESGPKYRMTEVELREAVDKLAAVRAKAESVPAAEVAPVKVRKPTKKE